MNRKYAILAFFSMLAIAPFATAAEVSASAGCISCHNGHTTAEAHPVGISYEKARATNYTLRFDPDESLLVDGKVECTSCHVTHEDPSVNRGRLRDGVSTSSTTLCASCHQ